jgi:hypothetical protein
MKVKLPDARKNAIPYRVELWLDDPEYRVANFPLVINKGDRIQEVAGAVAEAVFGALQKKSELKRLHIATESIGDLFDVPEEERPEHIASEYEATDNDIPF